MNLTSFDFETSGELPEYALQPWRIKQGKAWATSLAVVHQTGDEMVKAGGLNPTKEMMAEMMEEALRREQPITGWNTAFDIAILLAYGLEDLVFKTTWLDGMLLWRHFFIEPEYDTTRPNKKSYALQECIKEHLPVFKGYKDEVDFHNPDPEVRRKLHQINIKDTVAALQLTEHWYEQLSERQRKNARIEARALPHVAKANLEGLFVDRIATHELSNKLLQDQDNAINSFSVGDGVTAEIVASPAKLARLIFDYWKLPVLKTNIGKKTGAVSRSTDKEVLHELAFEDKRVARLRDYREAIGNRKKFADNILESVTYNEDGCTHPGGMVFSTYTGRLTYASKQGKGVNEKQTGFAIHQEKNDAEYRRVLISPPNHSILELDAMGQEFRWMAIASGDPVMLRLCRPGEDAHSYMGAEIEGKMGYHRLMKMIKEEDLLAKPIRKLGKVANLSLQYRTSARKLRTVARVQYDIPMTLSEAEHIHRIYKATYQRVLDYWATQINQTKRLGFVETFAGRRVTVEGDWVGQGWQMGSTAINYRIQGTGADMKYLALAVLGPYLVKHGIVFKFDMHDGLYFYVPDRVLDRAAVEMKYLLDNLPYEKAWGFKPPIPLPWEVHVGKSWGSLKSV